MHKVEEPLLLQLVLLLVIVEHVVLGDVQLDVEVVVVPPVTGCELLVDEVVVTGVELGGLTQMVLAHVVMVSGEVEHDVELSPLMVLQFFVLPVVVTEHVVIGDVQLVVEVEVVVLV